MATSPPNPDAKSDSGSDRDTLRRSWLRFSLSSLLLVALIGGPMTAWLYDRFFKDIYDEVDYDSFEAVGGISYEQSGHVMELLHSHRIPNIIEGSKIYGISVPPEHVDRAIKLVSEDSRKNGYWFEAVAD